MPEQRPAVTARLVSRPVAPTSWRTIPPLRLDAALIRPRGTITRGSATLVADRSAEGRKPEPEPDRLSHIIRSSDELSGNIEWRDLDKINRVITVEIPAKVAADTAYQDAKKNSDRQDARIEHDGAPRRVKMELLADHTELFKQFSDNPSFKKSAISTRKAPAFLIPLLLCAPILLHPATGQGTDDAHIHPVR